MDSRKVTPYELEQLERARQHAEEIAASESLRQLQEGIGQFGPELARVSEIVYPPRRKSHVQPATERVSKARISRPCRCRLKQYTMSKLQGMKRAYWERSGQWPTVEDIFEEINVERETSLTALKRHYLRHLGVTWNDI